MSAVRDLGRWRLHRLLAIGLSGLLLCVACAGEKIESAPGPDTGVPAEADPASVPAGTLLQSAPYEPVDIRITRAGATAQKITYRSTSGIDGSATSVTGAVFTPRKAPPPGGWPVVVFAHPTLGILEDCGPSRHTNMLGVTPQIELLLRNGYLVVMPDYQGLGSKGPHPYLEPRTAAYNVIDAVRAARELEQSASPRWAAYGVSQGGQAAWAAAELAPSYGNGLDMVGAVSLAPAADISPLPMAAYDRMLSKDQLPLMQFIVNAVSAVEPGLPIEDYLHGFALQNNEALLQCSGAALETRNGLALQLKDDDVAPADEVTADRLSQVLRRWSLPQQGPPSAVPIMVAVGSDDNMVPSDWTRQAVQRGCDQGETVVWSLQKGEGHDNVNYRPALAWLMERFDGTPLQDSCVLDGGPR